MEYVALVSGMQVMPKPLYALPKERLPLEPAIAVV
jgi:hypothetical protein